MFPPAKAYWLVLWTFTFIVFAASEPVQFCKSDAKASPNAAVDFCVALSTYQNISTSSHDFYMTITYPRYDGSPVGWMALGPGTVMAGSVMLIIYGDPQSQQSPVVSVRTSTGHYQPTLFKDLSASAKGGVDIRVLGSSWRLAEDSTAKTAADVPTYVATISAVCYGCTLWANTSISATSSSQPWIWAFNPNNDIAPYQEDEHLSMHSHNSQGYGNFYLDMQRSLTYSPLPPGFPPIIRGTTTIGASEIPDDHGASGLSVNQRGLLWRLHGLLLSTAFLLLFPLGVVAIRSASTKSFKYHWVIQLTATVLALLGIGVGIVLQPNITLAHQYIGVLVALIMFVQGVLGHRHHLFFIRLKRRTWISDAHVWLGRVVFAIACTNLIMGMLLKGYPVLQIVGVGLLMVGEAVCLGLWLMFKRRTTAVHRHTEMVRQPQRARTTPEIASEECFAIVDDKEDDGSSDGEIGENETTKMLNCEA
ncbi:MAG: hypothetical protein M4579_004854 [Chaenotheca gracillima]|nr:MAG: hypothetical protein M4579_004854 [Chaenotheca gracillima]